MPRKPISPHCWEFSFAAVLGPAAGAATLTSAKSDDRLRLLPVSPWVLALGLTLGALADLALLPLLPPLIATLLRGGWLAALPLLLFTLCAVALGQMLLRVSAVLANSRRLREGLGLLGPVAAGLILVLASRPAAHAAPPPSQTRPVWTSIGPSLRVTPPGLAAHAVAQRSIVPALPLALWSGAALLGVGGLLLRRTEREPERPAQRRRPLRLPWVPTEVEAVFRKESASLTREPFYRGGLGRLGLTTAALVLATLTPPSGPGDLLGFAGTALLAWAGTWTAQLACNQLGGDFTAGALLLSFPAPRWRLVLGKQFALGALLLPVTLGTLLLFGVAAKLPALRVGLFMGYGALWLLALLGLGGLFSALWPYPLIPRRGVEPSEGNASLLLGLGQLAVATVAIALATNLPWACPLLWAGCLPLSAQLLQRRQTALSELLAE
ncbi:MAG: hypothetical protein QM758_02830 [Armatimonas sp.]